MATIKFAYPFPKLLDRYNNLINLCQLIQVVKIDLSELTQEFRDYDTDHGTYPLPTTGEALLLIFLKPASMDCFTTIRKSNPQNLEYYQRLQGQTFDVVINLPEMEPAI